MTERKQFKTSAEAKPECHRLKNWCPTCKNIAGACITTPAQSIADTAAGAKQEEQALRARICRALDIKGNLSDDEIVTAAELHHYEFKRLFVADVVRAMNSPAIDAAPTDNAALIAETLHYPDHWDTAAYPDVWSALQEVMHTFQCSECMLDPAIDAAGASEGDVRDAKRYRWLRLAKYEDAIRAMFDFKGLVPLIPWRNAREQLDFAIDAAIAKENGDE